MWQLGGALLLQRRSNRQLAGRRHRAVLLPGWTMVRGVQLKGRSPHDAVAMPADTAGVANVPRGKVACKPIASALCMLHASFRAFLQGCGSVGGPCCPNPYNVGPGNLLCNSPSTFCNTTSSMESLYISYDVSCAGGDAAPAPTWLLRTGPTHAVRCISRAVRGSCCRAT